MLTKLWTYTVIAASFLQVGLQFTAASARAESPAQMDAGVDLIVTGLNSLTGDSPVDVTTMLQQIVIGLRLPPLSECTNPLTQTPVECLAGNAGNGFDGKIEKFLSAGVKSGKIDIVESALIARLFTAITDVSYQMDSSGKEVLDQNGNKITVVEVGATPAMPEPTGKGVPQPSLTIYRQNKIDFAALRKAKGMEEVLPADLAAQMMKAFPRKMNGVGTITAEEFFASILNRLQLNQLAGLMISATDLMTRPDAQVVSYPADYAFTSQALDKLQSQEAMVVRDISSAPDDATRAQYQTLLTTLRAQETALQQKDPIDALRTQRGQQNTTIQADEDKLASGTLSDTDRAAAIAEVINDRQAITQIDEQLTGLIRTNELAPTDVQRFAVNVLKQDLNTLNQNVPFSSLGLQIGDVLMGSWVSGDISSDALRALSQMSDLKETHTNIWKKILSTTWAVAQPVLMVVPTTSYIAIGVGIFLQIKQASAQANLSKENATHLIPDQN
jgi:hypothetical protein